MAQRSHPVTRRVLRVPSFALAAVASSSLLAGCPAKSTLPADALQTAPFQYLAGQDNDPMVPLQHGFPFPSNVWLVHEKSGLSVQFGKSTLPTIPGGFNTDPTPWMTSDGFSPGSAPMTYLPNATVGSAACVSASLVGQLPSSGTESCLATPNTIQHSLDADSPTIIIEADTGALVPHWAELDMSPTDGSALSLRAFEIRPVIRLKDSTRYIVAIRNVVDPTGTVIPPSPVFQALRDGSSSSDPTVAPRRALYSDILGRLSKAGVDKSNLQIAWDFTTASQKNNTASLLSMRDNALQVVGAAGPTYDTTPKMIPYGDAVHGIITFDANGNPTSNPLMDGALGNNKYLAMAVEGTFHVPLYLTNPQPPQHGQTTDCRLVRGPDGLPIQNGWADYPFLVQFPKSVVTSSTPAPIILNGHGLLGDRTEGYGGWLSSFGNDKQYVVVSINLTGFDHNAVNVAETAVQGDIGDFLNMVDPQQQGILNQMLVIRMLMGGFANDPRFFFDSDGTPDPTGGHSVIDVNHRFYRGDSQGGIMGASFMGVTTEVTRGYLGEPGMPYSLLLNRSLDFGPYFDLIYATYPTLGGRDIQIVVGIMQMLWDRSEPDGYAPYITQNPLPGTPVHQLLLNDAIGDFQVTPFSAHLMARTVGAKNIGPVNREVWGIDDVMGQYSGSGIMEFNFHLDMNPQVQLPITNIANNGPDNCDPHDNVRQESPVFDQQDLFFRQGILENFCTGATLLNSPTDALGTCDFNASVGQPCTPGGENDSPCAPTPEQITNMSLNVPPVACNPG